MSPRELLMEKRDKSMRRKLITSTSRARHAYFWKTFDRIFGEANQ